MAHRALTAHDHSVNGPALRGSAARPARPGAPALAQPLGHSNLLLLHPTLARLRSPPWAAPATRLATDFRAPAPPPRRRPRRRPRASAAFSSSPSASLAAVQPVGGPSPLPRAERDAPCVPVVASVAASVAANRTAEPRLARAPAVPVDASPGKCLPLPPRPQTNAPRVAAGEHVFLKAGGGTRQLCLPMSATLGEVWRVAGCPPLPLKVGSTYLRHAERTLASHGVTSGATLELMGGLRGGAPGLHSGWLEKLPLNQSIGKAFGLGWKRRWVVLYEDRVEWSESPSSGARGTMALGLNTKVNIREERLRVAGNQGQMLVLRGEDLSTWAAKIEQCVGPTLQRHEEDAVSSLSGLDANLIRALSEGWIALVDADWVREQPAGSRILPRQKMEEWAGEGVRPLLNPEEAVAAVRECSRCVGVLSHGWLLSGHCDPEGARMAVVQGALASRGYIRALFWE